MEKNYYLGLLQKKVQELKKVLEKLEKENVSDEYKKYLISGYIITLDSILEIGISDLHSSDLDELTSLIYYTRQKAVHYGYFNGIHNIEDIADRIITLTDTSYEETKIRKYYLKNSKKRAVLITSNKIGAKYIHTLCNSDEIDYLITP